jgi:WD40 repeat protein
MALHWSPVCEWELATTDRVGRVLFWDVRRAGAIACLDQQMTRINNMNRGSSNSDCSSIFQSNNNNNNINKMAHDGAINSIVPTPDGLFWLTSGGDDRIRCWDASTHKNMLTHYPHASNSAKKAMQVAISQDGGTSRSSNKGKGKGSGLLFQPTGAHIQVYDVRRGGMVHKLVGHMSGVNCCTWNEVSSELYSGDEDGYICVWDVGGEVGGSRGWGQEEKERNAAIVIDNDNDNGDESDWSD